MTILRIAMLFIIAGVLVGSMLADSRQDLAATSGARHSGPTTSALHFDISPAPPGGVAEVRIIVDHAEDVRGFNLVLQFGPNQLLDGTATDFQRNDAFLPARTIGTHSLNVARDGGPGRIRLIGLEPAPMSGTTEIGRLRLRVASNAAVGATQTVTLTGEIKDASGNVISIPAVVARFEVSPVPPIYLPLIQQGK